MKLLALFLLSLSAAVCSPITFTFQGTASGTIGTTSFTDASYTVTSVGDTNSVSFLDDAYGMTVTNSTIDIAGLPVATFTGPTYWADPQGAGDIIFGDGSFGPGFFPGILGITVLFQGLETYNLQSSIGPLYSSVDFPSSIFLSFQNISTNQGSLSLVASDETFVAAAAASTPEPGSVFLLAIGLAGLTLFAKRVRRQSLHPRAR